MDRRRMRMIYEAGAATRVERVEWRLRVEDGLLVALGLSLAAYFAAGADRPIEYLPSVGLIAVGILILITDVRHRRVCVIESDRVGYGFLNGQVHWLDRDRIGSVVVRRGWLSQVWFFDREGKLLASSVLRAFDPKELRQAFKAAGIPAR